MGYLPQALRNYLVRLGWSHGNDEIISTQQMLDWFDTNAIGKGASRFDFSKLEHLNGHYIRNSDDLFLVEQLVENAEFLEDSQPFKAPLSHAEQDLLVKAMPLLKEKAKTLGDLAKGTQFLFNQRPLVLDEKATKILDENSIEILKSLMPSLQKLAEWNADQLSQTVRDFCDLEELKLGKVAQPIRCAVAGTPTAPGVFEVMELFGKNETLARIADQLEK